jgi:predicted outer membrane repeat protein
MAASPIPTDSPNRATRRSLTRRGGALGAGGVLVAGSAAALLTALAGSAGAAATVTVDSNADGAADATHCTDGTPGNCTLRDAVAAAADGDTIDFDASISSITLTDGAMILGAENIIGPGSASLAITTSAPTSYDVFNFQGTGDVTVSGFSLSGNRIFTANQGKFTMNDVSISNSYGGYGGALYAANSSDLVISGCHFEDNTAGTRGGAVYAVSNGSVTVSDTEFLNNATFSSNGSGGGIFVGGNSTSFSLEDSDVTGNSSQDGGGLGAVTGGTVTIADSVISSNTAAGDGGGADIPVSGGQVTIDRTTIDGNTSNGYGGGLSMSRAIVMTNSTVSNNDAGYEGGGVRVVDISQATFNNTTISGNSSTEDGGGLYFYNVANVTMNQSTISNNDAIKGGGIASFNNGAAVVELSGTIVSGNIASIVSDLYGFSSTSVSLNSDHSILGLVSRGINVTDLGGTINSTTPGVLALANNGGPTMTMALDPTSVAIDAGPDPVAKFAGNEFDQRGTPFVRVSGSSVDIGAFELQPTPNPSTTTSSTTSTTAPPASTTTLAPDPTTTVAVDPMAPAFTG